jgi:hypothetical protein
VYPTGSPTRFCSSRDRHRRSFGSQEWRARLAPARTLVGALHRSRLRCVLLQGKVSPATVVVNEVVTQEAAQMGFVQHHDVVEALAAEGADEPFHVGILPRRPRRCLDFMDPRPFLPPCRGSVRFNPCRPPRLARGPASSQIGGVTESEREAEPRRQRLKPHDGVRSVSVRPLPRAAHASKPSPPRQSPAPAPPRCPAAGR